MIKVTYKMTSGAYKSKIIAEHELNEIKKKLLEARKNKQLIYWWIEKIGERNEIPT